MKILRTIDRWHFEAPLALTLAAAAGFAAMAMPQPLLGHVPLLGHLGRSAQPALALVLALASGGIGYVAMRRPARSVATYADEDGVDILGDPLEPIVSDGDGPVRMRRADRHPDAPPRPPIRASRDLGEPFMDVGSPTPDVGIAALPLSVDSREADVATSDPIDDAVPVAATAAPAVEPVEAADAVGPDPAAVDTLAADVALETDPAPSPVLAVVAIGDAAPATAPRDETSVTAMMERLSAGMARRAAHADRDAAAGVPTPMRDMRPALRGALDELNRLAARRG